MMDFFENRYYIINRFTLSLLGLWPYQHWCTRWIQVICVFALFTVIMFMLILKMVMMEQTIHLISYSLQFIVPCAAIILNLCYCSFNWNKMKMLLEHIKDDWSLLRPMDIKIIEKYSQMGRSCTLVLLTVSVVFLVFHQAGGIAIKNTHVPSNTSDWTKIIEMQLPIPILVPFVDHTKYFHCIVIFCFFSALIGVLVLAGIMALYLCSIQHACGMFNVVGCRLEAMFDKFEDILFCVNVIHVDVFESAMLHIRTIQFAGILNSLFGPLYFVIIGLHIVLLSSDIFQLFQAYAIFHNVRLTLTCSLHISGLLMATLIISYTGQTLVDHSRDVFNKAYSSHWYIAPIYMQKMLLLIITQNTGASALAITKSMTLSVEMFGKILQMSLSYFMALNSLQQKYM